MRWSSGRTGSVAACEPAAMMQLSKVIVRSPTATEFGPVKPRRSPWTTSTLRCLASPTRPPVSLSTTDSFHDSSAVEVDLGLAEADPVLGHLLGLGDHPRGVQQRLGGDAADVQAHAAERLVALDQHRLQPEVGGAEGRRVAAGTGADHDHLAS